MSRRFLAWTLACSVAIMVAPSTVASAANGVLTPVVVSDSGAVSKQSVMPAHAAHLGRVPSSEVGADVIHPDTSGLPIYESRSVSGIGVTRSTIFKSNSSTICVNPVNGTINGGTRTTQDILYFNLFHYHPLGGYGNTENRGPVYFALDGQSHYWCWHNQDTANQWFIGWENIVGPIPGKAFVNYALTN